MDPLTLLAVALLAGIATGTAGSTVSEANRENESDAIKKLRDKYGLTQEEAQAFYDQYRGNSSNVSGMGVLLPQNWFNGWGDPNWDTDWENLTADVEKFKKAYDVLGEMPTMPTDKDLARIQEEAYNEIDSENKQLASLYEQSLQNSTNQLNRELLENSAMFGDYRNQILTNQAMQQQAIAGSTRYELDRQQRNSIIRGASAAQRLVANINTQLGLQAQSAQQSLDTSNALAQNLLAHRQAQQDVRNAYLNAQNTYNSNIASTIAGQAERRNAYGQARKQEAISDSNVAKDAWIDQRDDYFRNNKVGATLYGKGKKDNY